MKERTTYGLAVVYLAVILLALVFFATREGASASMGTGMADQSYRAMGGPTPLPGSYIVTDFEDGQTISLSMFRGTPILLTTWTVDCAVCKESFVSLEQLWQSQKGKKLVVVAVNLDKPGMDAAIQSVISDLGISMLVWRDPAATFNKVFGVDKVPSTVLLNGMGQTAMKWTGPVDFQGTDVTWAVDLAWEYSK